MISYNPPSGPSTYQVFRGTEAQAQAKAFLAVNGSLDGPFATKAAAQAAIDAARGQPVGTAEPAPNPNMQKIEQDIPVIGPAMSTLQNVGDAAATTATAMSAIAEFFASLTQANTWRSLGWILLGAVLLISGIVLWLKQAGVIPETTPVPVPVPL